MIRVERYIRPASVSRKRHSSVFASDFNSRKLQYTQMATETTTVLAPGRKILTLNSAHGNVYRDISTAPPRAATAEEIPIIDLSKINSKNLEDRKSIALKIKAAAENTGFFYVENHGIEEEIIENAKASAMK